MLNDSYQAKVENSCPYISDTLPRNMSIDALKVELASRSGRDALPDFFPLDVVISLTRELALVVDRAQSLTELSELQKLMLGYVRKILEMQGRERLEIFESRKDELLPALVEELYAYMCEQLVSKVIGYDVRKGGLNERFAKLVEVGGDEAPLVDSNVSLSR